MIISGVTDKLFQILTADINLLARFKAKKEANFGQKPSNIARQKRNHHISSQTNRQRQ